MKKIGAILFLAGGIALVWFGWHGMQNPTATCGGEHMGSGDTCHYTGAGSSYTRDSADERNHNKFDSIFMMDSAACWRWAAPSGYSARAESLTPLAVSMG